jgi:Zn-finger nucleic acid-binding protein
MSDDPYRTAPYREIRGRDGLSRYCPRCDGVLTAYRRVYECGRECGVWLPVELVREMATTADLAASEIGVGPAPAQCAQCLQVMAIRRRGGVVFDFCAEHGVWLDTGERRDFEDARPWREVVLRALMLDEPQPFSAARRSPDAAEREELAWLDGESTRLDDEPR